MTTPNIQSLVESVKPVRDILGDPLVNNVPITPATQWIIDQQAEITRLRAERSALVAKVDCHPAYLESTIDDLIEQANRIPDADRLRQAESRARQLEAELAEEKRKVEEMRTLLVRCRDTFAWLHDRHGAQSAKLRGEEIGSALAALTAPSEGKDGE